VPKRTVLVNRAPVLTLWAAVVAERLGFDRDEALSLGKTVSSLTAQSKGRRLGIFTLRPKTKAELVQMKKAREFPVELLGRMIPCRRTPEGVRAVAKDKPVSSDPVSRYLEQKFGDSLSDVRKAMEKLARSFKPEVLAGLAFTLYTRFRPQIPAGTKGWGAKGRLDLGFVESLRGKKP